VPIEEDDVDLSGAPVAEMTSEPLPSTAPVQTTLPVRR